MLTLISHPRFQSRLRLQFVLRVAGAALLAVVLLNVKAHAGSSDYEPGGRYDFGDTSRGDYSSPSPLSQPESGSYNYDGSRYDFDRTGRGPEERQRDAVEQRRQAFVDSERRRSADAARPKADGYNGKNSLGWSYPGR